MTQYRDNAIPNLWKVIGQLSVARKEHAAPQTMTDVQVRARMEKTEKFLTGVERYSGAAASAVACSGIILSVVLSNILSLGAVGMIGICFATAAVLTGGGAFFAKKRDQWADEIVSLTGEKELRQKIKQQAAIDFSIDDTNGFKAYLTKKFNAAKQKLTAFDAEFGRPVSQDSERRFYVQDAENAALMYNQLQGPAAAASAQAARPSKP